MKEVTEQEALLRMMSYCASAEHCKADVVAKLAKWELSADKVESILNALVVESYIDEERYCRSFIYDKYRFAKWGKRKIMQALSLKKIPQEIIRKQLEEVNEEEYLAVLKELLEVKMRSVRAKNDYERRGKLFQYALGKGFDADDVTRVYPELSE